MIFDKIIIFLSTQKQANYFFEIFKILNPDILSFCSGTKTTSTAAVLMKSMPSKNESKNLMKKNRHEDSVLSAVNTEDFSGTTDARINCSVDSQHTLFSKTFSEHSGKTISSNMFDIDTIKVQNSGMRNSLEYHGSEFSENMDCFNQNFFIFILVTFTC